MKVIRRSGYLPTFFDDDFIRDFFHTPGRTNHQVPATNVKEDDKGFHLELVAPGFDKSDFKINVKEHTLTISAGVQKQNEDAGDRYTIREFQKRSFQRSFRLPEDRVNEADIAARFENGILHVSLPKKEVEKPKAKLIEIA